MSQEVFSKAEIFFQEKEEWYSFLNLVEYRDRIFGNWFLKCKAELNIRFQTNEIDFNEWLYFSWGNFSFKWYLKEFGPESLCLLFENSTLHLWANGNIYDVEKIHELLQNNKCNYSASFT
jgi:hypothetical protein